jgi:hypothetical protein
MEGRSLFRIALLVSSVAFTALAYRNSNGDNSEAVALATTAACSAGGGDCSASLAQQSRGPFGHEYSFRTGRSSAGRAPPVEVFVECKRELVLIGDWKCVPKTTPGGH